MTFPFGFAERCAALPASGTVSDGALGTGRLDQTVSFIISAALSGYSL